MTSGLGTAHAPGADRPTAVRGAPRGPRGPEAADRAEVETADRPHGRGRGWPATGPPPGLAHQPRPAHALAVLHMHPRRVFTFVHFGRRIVARGSRMGASLRVSPSRQVG